MISARSLVLGLTLLAPPALLLSQTSTAPQTPVSQQPVTSFRTGIDVVSLNVAVTDAEGHYVTDLAKADFQVFEDGVQQDVAFFSRENLPIAMALLLDTSASMDDKLATAQDAAVGFVKTLRPMDLGELVDFDSRVEVLQPFTNDHAPLEAAIRHTTAGGSTSLNNAVYIALKDFRKHRAAHPEDVRRQAIIVLSDGEDTSSLITPDEVLDLAKRSEVMIYTIGIRSKTTVASRGFHEAEYFLRSLAQDSGGRAFFPQRFEDLASVYGQIASEISRQYSVGYTSKNPKRDGAWRTVVVKIDRPNTTPRTKRGYYAPVTSHD